MGLEDSIKISDEGILLKIRIAPNASKNQIITTEEGIIKIKVTAQPVENKANKALTEYLSKYLRVPKTSVSIVKGETSKDKTIFISISDKTKQEEIKTKFQ